MIRKVTALFLIIIILLTGCTSGENKITKDMYEKIEAGMTIDEVESVLGKGEETAKTEAAGITIVNYQWTNSDGSNIQIIFQEGKVNTIAQAGLK